MRALLPLAAGLALVACSPEPDALPDTTDWWSEAQPYDVQEPLSFTEEPYGDLDGSLGDLLDDHLPVVESETTVGTELAPDDDYGDASCGSSFGTNRALPTEVEGIVTLMPRWYMKVDGCNRSEEKYYGNYFIESDDGGIFVIGDSKVAHFDMGDRVKLRVRGIRSNFGLDMIYVHDVVEVSREARPVHYAWAQDGLDADDMGQVRRVRGKVEAGPDTFGQLTVRTDEGEAVFVNLDSELNRRRAYPPIGTTLCATGPVLYSYSEYSIAVMRIGQLAVVDGDESCPD